MKRADSQAIKKERQDRIAALNEWSQAIKEERQNRIAANEQMWNHLGPRGNCWAG